MKNALFLALLPLVLFWGVEEYFGLKAALIVGCVVAVIEIVWEKTKNSKVSFITLASNSLILGLGGISFLMDSGVAFKLQPAVMEIGMAVFLVIVARRGEPFLLRTFREFKGADTAKREMLLSQAWFVEKIQKTDRRMVWFFLFHGLAVACAAVWGSTRMWILLKGVLFYVLMVAVMLPMYRRPKQTPGN